MNYVRIQNTEDKDKYKIIKNHIEIGSVFLCLEDYTLRVTVKVGNKSKQATVAISPYMNMEMYLEILLNSYNLTIYKGFSYDTG